MGVFIVVFESLVNNLRVNFHFFGEIIAGFEVFHESSAVVMFAVPFDFFAGLGVQDQSERSLVLQHFARDIVSSAEFIDESFSVSIEDDSSGTSKGLGSQELDLVVGVFRVDDTSGVDLDIFHVGGVGSSLF